ncbi:uncharacterized protein LOC119662389 [Teleopsis dalmanni]|uniref:uncharacterized protein LOC119662389 n=1 Tax=Teleopsis dalmanni TaxID=139649 RepID=UPI0018CE96BF|nr:uncharacterized protein LOC119662389 [Teleopsis dalmanni]
MDSEKKIKSKGEVQAVAVVTKDTLREDMWKKFADLNYYKTCMLQNKTIPHFVNNDVAANLLANTPEFEKAKHIKVNMDSALRPVTMKVLFSNKNLYLPATRQSNALVFKVDMADTAKKDKKNFLRAKYLKNYRTEVFSEQHIKLDMVIIGALVVSRDGYHIGRGSGFHDLELGMLFEIGAITPKTEVVTVVHDIQVVKSLPHHLFQKYDVPVDIIITNTKVIRIRKPLPRPIGIYWDLLTQSCVDNNLKLKAIYDQLVKNGFEISLKSEDVKAISEAEEEKSGFEISDKQSDDTVNTGEHVTSTNTANNDTVSTDFVSTITTSAYVASTKTANNNTMCTNFTNANTASARAASTNIANKNAVYTKLASTNTAGTNVANTNTINRNIVYTKLASANIIGTNVASTYIANENAVHTKLANTNVASTNPANAVHTKFASPHVSRANTANRNAVYTKLANTNTAGTNVASTYTANRNAVCTKFSGPNIASANIANKNALCTKFAGADSKNPHVPNANAVRTKFTSTNTVRPHVANANTSNRNVVYAKFARTNAPNTNVASIYTANRNAVCTKFVSTNTTSVNTANKNVASTNTTSINVASTNTVCTKFANGNIVSTNTANKNAVYTKFTSTTTKFANSAPKTRYRSTGDICVELINIGSNLCNRYLKEELIKRGICPASIVWKAHKTGCFLHFCKSDGPCTQDDIDKILKVLEDLSLAVNVNGVIKNCKVAPKKRRYNTKKYTK